MRAGVLIVLVASFALAGCGGESETTTVTVQETIAQEPPAATTQATTEAAPEVEPAPAQTGEIEVPDVVGKDHQLAQDTMQAAGLYNLSEEDATGEGRLLLFDRNWVVVEQDPPGGTLVNADQTITLRSKKDDE